MVFLLVSLYNPKKGTRVASTEDTRPCTWATVDLLFRKPTWLLMATGCRDTSEIGGTITVREGAQRVMEIPNPHSFQRGVVSIRLPITTAKRGFPPTRCGSRKAGGPFSWLVRGVPSAAGLAGTDQRWQQDVTEDGGGPRLLCAVGLPGLSDCLSGTSARKICLGVSTLFGIGLEGNQRKPPDWPTRSALSRVRLLEETPGSLSLLGVPCLGVV